ncbi:hypothetical protein ACFV0R_30910 [Streptomyces sp. NPDC059578]|uniref:hypothetical protein n=1 Tax=Streptomyces sp. NPDC059578 TaxID=3346874 RepID=UPI0036AC0158
MTRVEELLEDAVLRMPAAEQVRARAARRRTRRLTATGALAAAAVGLAGWNYSPGGDVQEVQAAAIPVASERPASSAKPKVDVAKPSKVRPPGVMLPPTNLTSMSDLWLTLKCDESKARPGPDRHHYLSVSKVSDGKGAATVERMTRYGDPRLAQEDHKDLRRVLAACGMTTKDTVTGPNRSPEALYEGRDTKGRSVTVLVDLDEYRLEITERVLAAR